MSKQIRRIIFYFLVVLFLIIGIATILYAEGWRLTLPKLKIEKVGALYLDISPNNASVFINGEKEKYKPSLFQNGILISDLLPGIYELKISAPDYKDFSQALTVASSMVTKMENLVLVPIVANAYQPATTTAASIQDFWMINQNDFILKENNQLTFNGNNIKGNEIIDSLPNSPYILTFDSRLNDYFLINTASTTQTVNLTLFLKNYFPGLGKETQIFADNQDASQLIIKSDNYWGSLDLSRYQISPLPYPALKNVYAKIKKLVFASNEIYILESSGGILKYDIPSDDAVMIAGGAKDLALSPDGNKLAILQNYAIKVFDSQSDSPEPLSFSPTDIKNASSLAWYFDNEHIFVGYPDKVNFLSLNDLALENYSSISSAAKYIYYPASNYLYIVKKGKIYYFQFPQ